MRTLPLCTNAKAPNRGVDELMALAPLMTTEAASTKRTPPLIWAKFEIKMLSTKLQNPPDTATAPPFSTAVFEIKDELKNNVSEAGDWKTEPPLARAKFALKIDPESLKEAMEEM